MEPEYNNPRNNRGNTTTRSNRQEAKCRTKNGKHFTGSKGSRKKAQKSNGRKNNLKRLFAGLLAAGVVLGGTSAIKKIVTDANKTKDLQTAVELADEHQRLLAKYPLAQQEQYSDKLAEQKELDNAINAYSELKDKDDRTLDEESKYIESIKIICESKDLVTDIYTDTIKSKVAALCGITDPEEIEKIEVKDYIEFDSSEGSEHNPVIELKNEKINKNEMDEEIVKAIIEARHLKDVDYSPDMKLEKLPIDDIISTYANAMKFGLEYDMSIDKKGKLIVIAREDNLRSKGTTNGNDVQINYNISNDDRDDR